MTTERSALLDSTSSPGRVPPALPVWFRAVVLGLLVGGLTYLLMGQLGLKMLPVALLGILGVLALLYVTNKEPAVILGAWLASMSGFQTAAMVRMPGLPDFSLVRLLSLWIIVMLLMRFLVMGRAPRRPLLPDILLGTWMVYLLVQLTVKQSPMFHAWTLCSLYPFIAYMMAKNYLDTSRSIKILFMVMMIVVLYFIVTAFGEHFGWRMLVWPKAILDRNVGNWWEGRARGPFLQPGLFGQMIGIYSLIYFYMLFRVRSLAAKAAVAMVILLSLLAVMFSFTRGAWLATFAGIATLPVLRRRYRKLMLSGALAVAIVAGIGALNFTQDRYVQERVENVDTIENRLGSWASAIRMIRDHPLFGVGFFRYTDYRDLYTQGTYFPLYGYIKRSASKHVVIHDVYMGRAAEEGLVSVGLLLAFSLITFRNFVRKWRANPQEPWFNRDILAVMAGIIMMYFVDGMTYDYRYFDVVNVVPLIFAGIINGYRNDLYLRS